MFGIALLGAQDSVVHHNSVLGNAPSKPAPFAGGIVLVSSRPLGGSVASHDAVVENHARKNRPDDVLWDGKGKGNKFKDNRCDRSSPSAICH